MKNNFKIYDCFMFNNEEFMLNLRLNILNNYIDKFVIVEGSLDHAGKKKKFNFNIKKFNKFKSKIIYIKIKNLPKKVKSFYIGKQYFHENHVRDQFQRNQIIRGLKKANKEDFIIISDIDEIPDLSKVNFEKINKCTIFFQRLFRIKLNLECKGDYPWQGSRIIKYKHLRSPQEIRNMFVKRIKPWQLHRYLLNPKFIKNGGWHFSSVLPLKKIKAKFKSGAHGELNIDYFNENLIKKKIKSRIDIIGKNRILTKVNIDKSFPDFILRNKNRLKKYII